MPADEEYDGIEIAGAEVPNNPILPPTTDPADTCDAYAEIEYAGECVPVSGIVYPDLTIEGDTCDAYAEIEYAGECVNINAVFQTLPKSVVEELDTSSGRLGCGTPLVFITFRCSGQMACQLDLSDITKLTWTRRLNEASEAEVEIGLTGDSSQTCCACLALVEPFCHELHIWRDGQEVWVGPIEAIRYERDTVTIKARDSLAWLDVRIPQEDILFETVMSGTANIPIPASGIFLYSDAQFTTLPNIGAVSGPRVAVIFGDPANPADREFMTIRTHTAGSPTVNLNRGMFNSSPKAHLLGAPWTAGAVGASGPNADLTDIAYFLIQDAFQDELFTDSPLTCEIENVYQSATGEVIQWLKEAFNQTFLEILTDLSETELDFTTIGRTIVLSGDTASKTPLVLLNDDHIMGEIEVTKDGKVMANRYFVHYEGDEGIPAAGATSIEDRYCYSLIERIADGSGLTEVNGAQFVADAYVSASAIAPRVLEIPAGSKLSPDTPWTVDQMVCGARVDVAVTRLCLELTQSFILVGMAAEYTSSEGEAITIEITPINSTATV